MSSSDSSSESYSDYFGTSSESSSSFDDYFEEEIPQQRVGTKTLVAQNNITLINEQSKQERISSIAQQLKAGRQQVIFHKLPEDLYLVST
jgi:hypothetical protein